MKNEENEMAKCNRLRPIEPYNRPRYHRPIRPNYVCIEDEVNSFFELFS